jgi:hypothetical protein
MMSEVAPGKPKAYLLNYAVHMEFEISPNVHAECKPAFLRACEKEKVSQQSTNTMQIFINRCLRRALNIRRTEAIK